MKQIAKAQSPSAAAVEYPQVQEVHLDSTPSGTTTKIAAIADHDMATKVNSSTCCIHRGESRISVNPSSLLFWRNGQRDPAWNLPIAIENGTSVQQCPALLKVGSSH